MLAIIQDIIFPIVQYSEADAELWESDPYEYIRSKFGEFELCSAVTYTYFTHF